MSTKIKPVRIQRSRQHKQVSPNGLPIVYVGRPTKWGNPFKVVYIRPRVWGVRLRRKYPNDINASRILVAWCSLEYLDKNEAVNDAIKCFEIYLAHLSVKHNEYLTEIKGKNLSCWCKPGSPCHADVLLELANK